MKLYPHYCSAVRLCERDVGANIPTPSNQDVGKNLVAVERSRAKTRSETVTMTVLCIAGLAPILEVF